MTEREAVEKLLSEVSRRRDEAEARAGRAARELARFSSGLTPLAEVDPEQVRAAADAFAGALQRLRLLEEFKADLRGLLF